MPGTRINSSQEYAALAKPTIALPVSEMNQEAQKSSMVPKPLVSILLRNRV